MMNLRFILYWIDPSARQCPPPETPFLITGPLPPLPIY
jgi:hypothetical protein